MMSQVKDEKGRKMSKSLGNVVDPLDVIGTYSCDALRFTLATGGRTICNTLALLHPTLGQGVLLLVGKPHIPTHCIASPCQKQISGVL